MGILITGVNGFIGHYLANKFLSKNIEVYGVYRNNIPQIRNKNFFKVNINNKNFSIPKNISTIFHLAAESPGKYNNKNFIKNNLEITKKILKYCKDKNIKKIFYFSSIVVYEQFNKKKKILNEDMKKIKPKSSYARSKIICENFVKKQTDIIKFVSLYCREGDPSIPNIHDGEMEDEWWLYCNETNTKLLPKFHYILASTFINNNSKYDDILNEL